MRLLYGASFFLLLIAQSWFQNTGYAQKQPDAAVINALTGLDRISSYGDYSQFDSTQKFEINDAIRVCSAYLDQKPDSITRSMFLYHKGRLEYVKKEIELARADLEQALHYDISNYPALERLCVLSWNHLKNYYVRKDYINDGIRIWSQKCYYDSLNSFQWYYLAKTYELQHQFSGVQNTTERIRCLKRCIALDSNNGNFYFEYSLLLTDAKQLKMLKKAISKEENWLYRSHILAWYEAHKQSDHLLAYLNESIALYEEYYPNYYFFLADLYQQKAKVCKMKKNMTAYKFCMEKYRFYSHPPGGQ